MLKKQKGITLIALIITIIVMLILVGVTINVALNGGLFDKAKDAKEKTAAATEKEQLLNAVFATLDDNGNVNLGNIELPDDFEMVSEDETKVVYKNKISGKEYEVSKETGTIIDKDDKDKEDKDEGEDLGQFYLKYLQVASGIIDPSDLSEEEITVYTAEVERLFNEGLIYSFAIEDDIGDYTPFYVSVNGYNYYCINDGRGSDESEGNTVSLIAKDSNDYNKVNSLVEESKSLEEELFLIGSGYTFTNVDTTEIGTYISNKLSEDRTVEIVAWGPGRLKLSTYSTVDSNVLLEFYIDYSNESPHKPTNMVNINRNLNII